MFFSRPSEKRPRPQLHFWGEQNNIQSYCHQQAWCQRKAPSEFDTIQDSLLPSQGITAHEKTIGAGRCLIRHPLRLGLTSRQTVWTSALPRCLVDDDSVVGVAYDLRVSSQRNQSTSNKRYAVVKGLQLNLILRHFSFCLQSVGFWINRKQIRLIKF